MIEIAITLDGFMQHKNRKIQVSDRNSSPLLIRSFSLEFSDDSQSEEKAKGDSQGTVVHGEDDSAFDTNCPTKAASLDVSPVSRTHSLSQLASSSSSLLC